MAENRRNGACGMSYLCIVNQKSVLEHHSTSANEYVEEAWRISSTPRVNWLLLHS
ncbi:MAG: hypothetical protein U0L19_02010 [Bacteroidales bacterium]|nr:hypothetical protein [Bacteroidales bacterium]